MSRQLSGQLSPLSHLNPVLPFRRPIASTGNVFTPNQLFKFDKKRKKKSQVLCWYLIKIVIIIIIIIIILVLAISAF